MIKVIAFDPGVTTGYAQGIIYDEGPMQVGTGEGRWTVGDCWSFISDFKPQYLITERFDSRHTRYRQGVELFSRELIGVFNMYCEFNECKLVQQPPMKGGGTTYFSDARLKEAIIHKPGKGHANDAARHLLYWYWFTGGGKYNSRQRGYESVLK